MLCASVMLVMSVSGFSASPNFPRGSSTQYDNSNPYPSTNNPYGYNNNNNNHQGGGMIMDRSRQRAAQALDERRQTPGSYHANDWHSHAGAAKGYSQSQFSTYAEQRREEANYQRNNNNYVNQRQNHNNWQHRNMNPRRVEREEGPYDYQRQMNHQNNGGRDLFDYNRGGNSYNYDPYYDPNRFDPIDRHQHKAAQASMNRGAARNNNYYYNEHRPNSFQDQRRRDVEADFPRNQYQGNDMFRRQDSYRMPNNYDNYNDNYNGRMEPGAYARSDWWEKAGRQDARPYRYNTGQGNFMTYSDQRAEAAWEEKNRNNRYDYYDNGDRDGYRADGRRRYSGY